MSKLKLHHLLLSVIGILVMTAVGVSTALASPSSVTLVGDLQDELGCPGNNQPDCAATHLVEQGYGVWRGVFTVPAGDWQYQMALNDTLDISYPADIKLLSLGAETAVRFYYDDKTNAVVDSINDYVAIAAGSFQSELGCPGDWQPECVNTLLTDVDGDGIYTFSTDQIPASSYEFRVALDEAWDTAYPGSDVSFTAPAGGGLVTINWDSATYNVSVTVDTSYVPLEISSLVSAPARDPIQDDVFYFVMPDRFDNGATDNDEGGIPGDRLAHGFDPEDKGFFHGGDLAGLTARLDYLADMGTTAIWMTPVFKNKPVQGIGADASAGYHGYWYVDMEQIDPHFGTNDELEILITQAHNRDIKVFFDIITNHTADIIDYEEGTYSYRDKEDYHYKDASGVEFDDRDFVGTGTFPELDPAISFPYSPKFNTPDDVTTKVPAWLNNPIYYHNRGNSTFSGESSLYGDFFGLDDMFTEHPDVVDSMIDIYKGWITSYEIDGFRVDTVKHVNLEFWQEFVPAILAHAESVGRDEFFVFGEVYSVNPALLSHYTSRADFPAVLDFHFQEQVRAYASSEGNSDNLRDLFADDDYFTDADSNAYALPTFIGNHDMGRFGWFLDVDNGVLPDDEKAARSQLATAMMFFARGVPVIYYGDEQGFVGDGGDKDARQDMMDSQVLSYNADDLIGTSATTADANFDQTHPLYESYNEFAAVLAAHPALQSGAQLHRYSQAAPGIYAFSRIDRDEQVEYLVIFNNANSAQSASFSTDSPNTTFSEIYPGTGTISSDADGNVAVIQDAISFAIYNADAPLPASQAAPGVSFNTLVNDQEVELETQNLDGNEVQERIEVGVALTDEKYAEVTFAVRKSGTLDYTVIGVDDNAPYRVFFSLEDVPGGFNAGDMLDFVAVVADNNGNLNYAEVTGIKPIEAQPTDVYGPIITVTASPNPTPVGTDILVLADLDDITTGGSNIVSAEYTLDSGTAKSLGSQEGGFDSAFEQVEVTVDTTATPTVQEICISASDAENNITRECLLLVWYDPDGGFVTGGGWIESPAGAYYPIDLQVFDGSYYELGFADPPVDWDDARDLANSMVIAGCANAHLATVTKQGEQDVISGLMAETTTNGWLGGYQIQEGPFDPDIDIGDDDWYWVTGETFDYRNWAGGEPNDTPWGTYEVGSEQFLETLQGSGEWNDAPVEDKYHYIIEYDDCDLPTGKATFGFVSKYKKGADIPTGHTEFKFKAGDLNFDSTSYDWLLVTGSDFAKFKGVGTINDEGDYKFKIWAGDGTGDGGTDTFRIKIWEEIDDTEYVIYDNGMNQSIGAGNIVVHTKKSK